MINNLFKQCHSTLPALVLYCWTALFNVDLAESNKGHELKADLKSCHCDTVSRLTHMHVWKYLFSDESGMSPDLWFTSPYCILAPATDWDDGNDQLKTPSQI